MNKSIWLYAALAACLITCPLRHADAQIQPVQGDETSAAKSSTHFPLSYPAVQAEKNLAQILSSQCETAGDDARGRETCSRVYSNGRVLKAIRHHETEGNIEKHQLILTELDLQGHAMGSKTIRQKIEYAEDSQRKIKTKEYFDIVKRPLEGKITRELIVHEYAAETGLAVHTTWTKYRQIDDQAFASLQYHVALSYDREGNPLEGTVEKWAEGKLTETLSPTRALWPEWQEKIRQASRMELA
ncbi:MAG: hypothetical protein WC352_05975 [Candidatus Omnitrophota bacterium]|jgi:hypothetical protein